MFTYFWERETERQHEWKRSRARGRHRIQSRVQALSCQHRARCEAWTHKPWDHDLSRSRTLNRLATQVPLSCSHLISFYLHIPLTGHIIHSLLQCSTILVTQHFASTAFTSCYQWKLPLYPCSHRLPFTALFLCPSGPLIFHQLCLSLS